MAGIFTAEGIDELTRLAALPSALVFDLDGTLAPIVPKPADARVPDSTSDLLMALSRLWPLGIITGRAIDDAREKIGFTPHYLYGNHGAERSEHVMNAMMIANKSEELDRTTPGTLRMHLNPIRGHLCRNSAALALRGITFEDKGLSLALHYPKSFDSVQTRTWLDELVLPIAAGILTSHGHQVMNITPVAAPDKGDALLEIMQHCGAVRAFMIGDDINDECAFGKAPPGSVTVRVGPLQMHTQARFTLSSQLQINRLLATLLALRSQDF